MDELEAAAAVSATRVGHRERIADGDGGVDRAAATPENRHADARVAGA